VTGLTAAPPRHTVRTAMIMGLPFSVHLRGAADPFAMAARHPGTVERSTSGALAAYAANEHPAVAAARGVGPPQSRPHRSPSLVVVAGSIVLVGEARGLLLDLPRDPPVAL